jgi:2-alkenal reductase
VFVLLIGLFIGGVVSYMVITDITPEAQATMPTSLQTQPQSTGVNMPPSTNLPQSATVDAVAKALPAVVTVINEIGPNAGSGSGFFIGDGYIVTNNHVVEGNGRVSIVYAHGGIAPAEVVGTAPEFDLAVLKVDGLVPAIVGWGDSSELPLGSEVIAIGSALGRYQNTVTVGVLSGFNRELGGLRGLLQTDAAINHGNSGGPLINLAGQVVGINTMVIRGEMSAEAQGLGFAIPSDIARNVVQRLINRGDVKPPFLGIQYQQLNPQLAAEQHLSIAEGAYVDLVLDDTPASEAGLQEQDVIISVGGQQIDDRHPLVSILFEYAAGDTVAIKISRGGRIIERNLTLVERH